MQGVWVANIALVVGAKPETEAYVDELGTAISSGSRKVFSYVTQDSLLSQVCKERYKKSQLLVLLLQI